MFPVTNSVPSSAALSAYLSTIYMLGDDKPVECFLVSQGWADVFLVRTSDRSNRYFLKVFAAAWRSEADILFELDFMQYLDRKGLSIAMPIPAREGNLVHPLDLPEGRRYMVLFNAAPGQPLTQQPMNVQSRRLGMLLAQCHEAAVDFTSSNGRQPVDLESLLNLSPLEPLATGHEDILAYLQHAADRVRKVLQALPIEALQLGVCHGDLGAQNVFLTDELPDGKCTIIDFSDCGRGWFAQDLGHTFMGYHLFQREQAPGLWQAFLEGYRSQRPLAEVEVAAAPAFAVARFLQVHAHDNPIGASRDRWPASSYLDGAMWDWMRKHVQSLESCL